MIDIKEAVRIASEHVSGLYGEKTNPALEEVELSSDGEHWLVTMAFSDAQSLSAIEAMTGEQLKAQHKVLKIVAETGTVVAIKDRD